MQSERVKVLVGNAKDAFWVPNDLLAQYSTAFKKLLNPLNDSGDEIVLPDVTKATFEDFFIWLHAYEPSILHTGSHDSEIIDGALHLAVFAQKFQIYHLRNQASDVVRAALREGQWNITPDMISAVYKVAPAGSALRQLSFHGFVAAEGRNDSTVWQAAFIDCPSLGWDYFQYKNNNETQSEGIEAGGACRFHDHSDIRGWTLHDIPQCPYPHGAPRLLPGQEFVPFTVPAPELHEIVVQGAVDPPLVVEEEPLPRPPTPPPAEPEPEEPPAVDEPLVEPSVGGPSESAWGASETTETEPIEIEPPKFEPAEQPLIEETTVIKDWVNKTDQAEPVDAPEILPADEEPSHVAVEKESTPEIDDQEVVSKVTLVRRLPVVEEKKEPVVLEGPVVVRSPVFEHVETVKDLSVAMGRQESTMSSIEQTGQKKKKGKKGRK
jgi:hypothetical protein